VLITLEKAVISLDPLISKELYFGPEASALPVYQRLCAYSDITWHDGQFYGVDFWGNVVIFDFRSGNYPMSARVVRSEIT